MYDESGNLTAIFATDLSLLTISEFLRELKVGKTGQSFVIERSGTLIATSTTDKPYALNQANKPEPIAADKSTNLITKTTTQQLYQRFGDLQKINQPEQLSFKVNRDRVFVEVSPIQDTHGIDWLSVVVIPEADFMEQINTNARNTALLCLLTLGLATAAGIFISRRITRLILNLSEASQAIAQGNLDRLVNVQGIRELETLGRSFNQMAVQLRESFAALEQVNKELETRVENRTAELKAANTEISLLNNKLKAENVRMSAELNVARKLQEMILPKEKELTQIAPLDIAGFMEAAAEVGGDYYDVLRNNQQIKIGIGDVTGHGLESGVLMIMTQTAVRTLQAVNEHDPVKALSALNRVIYQNAKRMNSDKNLTLALIDYQDGVLHLYGQHEEAILVRTNGEVERIDTLELGFPIGLVDDITDFVAQKQIQLSPGDGVVLYTDGITEAENNQRQLYGIDRLITVIQRYWQHSASEIRSAIVEDVRNFIGDSKVYDDITLVVLKQK
uniref:HAMP domain-containing protein n=1 Tax=Oscillatoriales cyanobacterium SpSt-418 TaxID=2282169 RepID=A0A7C3KGV1_9CYAN